MKALLVGAGGQLGRALVAAAPPEVEVVACDRSRLDIGDAEQVRESVRREAPVFLVNAAAYTAVDRAESEQALARAVNATAVGNLAAAAREVGARFVHVSTDFVFDGAQGAPYRPEDAPNPLGVYGATKLEGEELAGPDALIVRTGWVYGPQGANFVRTMLRLLAAHPMVRVVADQTGTPTYAPDLAKCLWTLAISGCTGMYHYSNSGVASWYDFAVAIREEAMELGLLDVSVPVVPIRTIDYPTPARRPSFSVLEKSATWEALGDAAPHWREQLRIMLNEIRSHG